MHGTVWESGCASFYLDVTGRNGVLWPDWTWRFPGSRRGSTRAPTRSPRPSARRSWHERQADHRHRGGERHRAATMAELERRGQRVLGLDIAAASERIIACDVRDQESVDRAVAEAIERLGGGLDVLVNVAGLATPQSAGLPPDERALAVIDVNMVGPWRVTSAALPALRTARADESSTSRPAWPSWRCRSPPRTR